MSSIVVTDDERRASILKSDHRVSELLSSALDEVCPLRIVMRKEGAVGEQRQPTFSAGAGRHEQGHANGATQGQAAATCSAVDASAPSPRRINTARNIYAPYSNSSRSQFSAPRRHRAAG